MANIKKEIEKKVNSFRSRITGRCSSPELTQRSGEPSDAPPDALSGVPAKEANGPAPPSDLEEKLEQQISDGDSDPIDTSGRIRILIIGREGAGKMTILQKACNSTEDPEIYDYQGKKVKPGIKGPSEPRHNIEHQVVFKSDQKYVFHVSLSFEARFEDEFKTMKNFVIENVKSTSPKQVHAIWYCIPMDQFHHAVSSAERMFFDECDTGNVPVVLIFTKWDALVTQAFQPEYLKLPPKDQLKKQVKQAQENFDKRDVWGELCKKAFPPKAHVQLERLDKPDADCNILLEQTTKLLAVA